MSHKPRPPLAQHRPPQEPPHHGGQRPRGRRRADLGADDDQHRHLGRGRDRGADPAGGGCGRRYRAGLDARRKLDPRAEGDRARKPRADRRGHPLPTTSAPSRRPEAGAACLRINPGNIGSADRVREVIRAAKDHGCSIRIGVNAGSLERHLLEKYGEPCPEAMVESGLDHIRILQDNDFHEFKISVKASDVFLAAAAYQSLAEATDAPIHLGITEAGGLMSGTIKSAIGLGNLLWMGIGDTLRGQPLGRPDRGGEGGLRDPEGARAPAPRREHHLLPVLRAAGVRRDQDGRGAGGAAGACEDADVAVDHRLRGERAGARR
jgi:hypothetical protein